MKKILTFCWCLLSVYSHAQSPITLDRSDFPCPTTSNCGLPDSALYTNVPIVGNTINTAQTGANNNWDMSQLQNGTIAYQNLLPMSGTPLVFQLVFLSCDYAQPLLGNNIIGNLPVTDAYEYYNYAGTNSSRLEIKGFGAYVTIPGQTTAIPLPAIYSSPDIVYQFPITFGNIDSSNSGYSVTIPLGGTIGDITFKRNQKEINEVDGWGSITTPAGTFDVLRVKSSITRMDSLITGLFPIGFPSSPVEYKWLGKTKRIPVFQTNGNLTGSTFTTTATTFWGQAPTGVSDISSLEKMNVYPNPISSNCTIQYSLKRESNIDVRITTIDGKSVGEFHFKDQIAGNHHEILPLSALPNGSYIITCTSNDELISTQLMKF